MALSSIHIATGKAHFLNHNSRENFSKSVVFFDEENSYFNNAKSAFSLYRNELKIRSEAYSERKGKALHKKTVTHLSAIINLNAYTKEEDVLKLIKKLENDLDTKVFQVAIHRDEGHLVHKQTGLTLASGKDFFANPDDKKLYFDSKFEKPINLEDFEIRKNYHAHVEFMGLDSTGASVSRKINRTYLRNLQTETAQILGMERGKTKGAKHLEPNEFKNLKSKETVAVYVSTADLKKENARLRAELKERGATREDYAKLEAENKRLKELVKSKNLTIEELKKSTKKIEIDLFGKSKIKTIEQEHKAKLKSKDETIKKIKFKVKELEREKESFDEIAPRIYKAMEDYKARAEDLEEKNERLVKENNKLMQENTFLKNAVEALKNAILDKPREIVAQFKNELSRYFKIDVAPKPKEREPEDYQGRHL
jgi:hypothetical protein